MLQQMFMQARHSLIQIRLRYISHEADELKQVVQCLCVETQLTQLKRLDLGSNTEMWADDNNVDLIIPFICQQESLEGLEVGWQNYLTSETSLRIMQAILQAPCLQVLKKLDLADCSWDEQENCTAIANIIARAGSLAEVVVSTHESDREIKIERKAALLEADGVVQTMGFVKIIDEETEEVICQVDCETA